MNAIPRFKPYPAYKDSGVEWLGQIPAGWQVQRADSFLRYDKLQIEPSEISGELVFHYSIPAVQETGNGALEPPSDIDSAKLRIVGERLLVSKLNPRKGVVLLAYQHNVTTVCSSEFVPFDVRGIDVRWALYLFLAESTRQRLSAVVRSATRSHQRAEVAEITKIWHGVPSLPEQKSIAAFLDRETARLDALVAKKERLIDLLHEQRTALITRAVTKGLDPTVPMRDSGVEWLGEIPTHWEVRKVKRLCLVRRGASPRPIEDPIYFDDDGEYAWVRIADVTASDRYLEATTQRLSDLGKSKSVALEPGELFVSIAATVGKPIITKIKCCIHDGFVYFVGLRANREYLFYLFSCGEAYKGLGKLGTQLNLNTDTIGDIYVPRPSPSEQDAIVSFLDAATARVDALVMKVRDAIERLKELRTALVSAAVTGKIDLREAAA